VGTGKGNKDSNRHFENINSLLHEINSLKLC
jgi:hypothetical protein